MKIVETHIVRSDDDERGVQEVRIQTHGRLLWLSLRYRREFRLGWKEAHSGFGMTYDNDPWSDRSQAYDYGRNLRLRGRA